MGSSTSNYGCFIIDRQELIDSLGQEEHFEPLPEIRGVKKRFSPDSGEELKPEKFIERPAVPSHKQIMCIFDHHIVLNEVVISDPEYKVPVEPWYGARVGSKERKPWETHRAVLAAARENVDDNGKLRVFEGFLYGLQRKAEKLGKKFPWSYEYDGWSGEDNARLIQHNDLQASSYGERESRRIKWSDIQKAMPDIEEMKTVLASYGMKKIEFSFRTIWYE